MKEFGEMLNEGAAWGGMLCALDMAELMYVVGSILIIPAIIFALVAQGKVQSAFNRYSEIGALCGMKASDVARRLLDQNGCGDVQVVPVRGMLTDHYDPRKKVVALSSEVYGSTSLAAIGIAAHECGHAIQHHVRYAPLILRQLVIRSTSLVNKLLVPLIIIGLIASICTTGHMILGMASERFWFIFILIFCVMYAISFVINLITLPTEYDASRRGKKILRDSGFIKGEDEEYAVRKVLGAAALTYVAALIISLAYLLRFLGLILSLSRRR